MLCVALTSQLPSDLPALGVVYLPGGSGTPVGKFDFLVDAEHGGTVEVGSLVTADTDEGRVIGIVTDMATVGTDPDPVTADLSRRPTGRAGLVPAVRCATVQVLTSASLRPVGPGEVHAATRADVDEATNVNQMQWPIPVGAVRLADGTYAPVNVDGAYLLGPEAQGMLCLGRSGIASKSSFMTVAMRSALARSNNTDRRVGLLVFNVKGTDLVSLDEPPAPDKALTGDDEAIYDAMGLAPIPFDQMCVYAVPALDGGPLSAARTDALPLQWDLKRTWSWLSFFFDTVHDEKVRGFIALFEESLLRHRDPTRRIDTFEKLDQWFVSELDIATENGDDYIFHGQVHVMTARKLRGMFRRLHGRGRGLFAKGLLTGSDADVPDTGWHNGDTRVVDLAGLTPEVQGFAIARTVDRMMRSAERGELGVDHLIVVTDELNAWAPNGASREVERVRRSLQRVATQGRYAGLSLFGSAQAASKIDDLLRDNCSTRALGQSAETELTSGVHGRLPGGLLERIASLPKGQMLLTSSSFRQPIVVQFPRPAWAMGRSQTTAGSRPTAQSVLREHMGERAFQKASRDLDDDQIADIAASAGTLSDAVAAVTAAAPTDPDRLHASRTVDPADPYALLDD